MEDTEWTDALKKYGIIKDEPKPMEPEPEPQPDTGKRIPPPNGFADSDEEDAWLEDQLDDDDFLREYRQKRVQEMQLDSMKSRFGQVKEISGVDYVQEVNKAGPDIWVVLLLYRQGSAICNQMQHIFNDLAQRFPETKFLKSIATQCIPNFPDQNLPAVFVYHNGQLVKQLIGPAIFGTETITKEEVEWIIARTGAIKTELQQDPRKQMYESRKKFYQKFGSDDEED